MTQLSVSKALVPVSPAREHPPQQQRTAMRVQEAYGAASAPVRPNEDVVDFSDTMTQKLSGAASKSQKVVPSPKPSSIMETPETREQVRTTYANPSASLTEQTSLPGSLISIRV